MPMTPDFNLASTVFISIAPAIVGLQKQHGNYKDPPILSFALAGRSRYSAIPFGHEASLRLNYGQKEICVDLLIFCSRNSPPVLG